MTETNQTIGSNNVREIDQQDNDERYEIVTNEPRHADETVGHILRDTETGETHIAYQNSDVESDDYRIVAHDIELQINGENVTYPLNDLDATASHGSSGVYTHKITNSSVKIEYKDAEGVPQETIDAAPDNWHVEAEVVEK